MLKIIAAAYEDGYAFVQEQDSIYLIRPPYKDKNKRPATLSNVERAITAHGFTAENSEGFSSWDLLIRHLMDQLAQKRKEAGRGAPDTEKIRSIFQRADKDTVKQYLDRVEHELIPGRKWKAAISLLMTFLKNKHVQEDEKLRSRCLDLLDHCHTTRDKEEEERNDFFDGKDKMREKFELAIKYFPEALLLNEMVRNDGQVIKPGGSY